MQNLTQLDSSWTNASVIFLQSIAFDVVMTQNVKTVLYKNRCTTLSDAYHDSKWFDMRSSACHVLSRVISHSQCQGHISCCVTYVTHPTSAESHQNINSREKSISQHTSSSVAILSSAAAILIIVNNAEDLIWSICTDILGYICLSLDLFIQQFQSLFSMIINSPL